MIHALIIAVVVVLFMADSIARPWLAGAGLQPWAIAGWTLGSLALCWLVPAVFVRRAIRRMDRAGEASPALRSERFIALGRPIAVGVFAFAVFALGWVGVVRQVVGDWIVLDEMVIVAPVLMVFVLGWWSLEPIERRFREATLVRDLDSGTPVFEMPTRAQAVWLQVRHQLLAVFVPLILIMAWSEAIDRVAMSGPEPVRRALGNELTASLATFAGVGVIFALAPMMLRLIWSTVPLGAGPMREHLLAMARRHRVGLRDILVWRTHGQMTNAAAMGLFAPLRYILLSDALLEYLRPIEVEAVAAHEIAHVRHHHIAWLASFVLSSATLMAVVMGWLAQTVLGVDPNADGPAIVLTGVALAGALFAFGWVSRRFEWQADAFAVEHLSTAETDDSTAPITPDAIAAMAGALARVASRSGMTHSKRSWRHGSIGERIRRLKALEAVPADAVAIDRKVRWIKRATALLVLIALGLVAAEFAQSPGDPAIEDTATEIAPRRDYHRNPAGHRDLPGARSEVV